MKKYICIALVLIACALCGCGDRMKDGFYTAEMTEEKNGWKEYLCIMVENEQIVYAEYNARDESGYIKSWDNSYMQLMKSMVGTYPNEYTRNYVAQLIENQNAESLDALTGASSSAGNFKKLVEAVIQQAKKGDSNIVFVE